LSPSIFKVLTSNMRMTPIEAPKCFTFINAFEYIYIVGETLKQLIAPSIERAFKRDMHTQLSRVQLFVNIWIDMN
jgi:hypothetical protein